MNASSPYQIDWTTASSGKRVATTKRRVKFSFGFSNSNALEKGMTGNEARGAEHEVALTWSLTSNKRTVVMDGKEIHYSTGRRGDTKFETTWPINGGHTLKIIAHAALPLRATPEFKQYDLILDGVSFFHLPKIFELGIRRGPVARAVDPSVHAYAFAHGGYRQEEARRRTTAVSFHEEVNYRPNYQGYDDGPVRRSTIEAIAVETSPRPQEVMAESAAPSDLFLSQSSVTPAVDEFAPVQVQPQPPTFQQVSNQILSAYGPAQNATAPAPLVLANSPATHYTPQVQAPVQHQQSAGVPYTHQEHQTYALQPAMVSPDASASASGGVFGSQQQQPVTTPQLAVEPQSPTSPVPVAAPVTPTLTMMKPLEVDELRDNYSPTPVDAMDQAVQNLVNLNDLKETRTTPEQIKAKKQKELQQSTELKSRPRAPAATSWHVGTNASLADIQKHKKPLAPPTKEVMKVHAFDPAAAQAGMMVIYGQQPQGYPGSVPAPSGFGVGHVYRHGYNYPMRY